MPTVQVSVTDPVQPPGTDHDHVARGVVENMLGDGTENSTSSNSVSPRLPITHGPSVLSAAVRFAGEMKAEREKYKHMLNTIFCAATII
jgi:hypothetical protein